MARVLIVMGSDSDVPNIEGAWKVLEELGVAFDVRVASAHRTPDVVHEMATGAREAGYSVVIAAAGIAAHLAGVFASLTTLPVVAVPMPTGTLGGLDALLSGVQMPPGVPIASMGIGGAKNAGLFAAAILAVSDSAMKTRLDLYRQKMAEGVRDADLRLRAKVATKPT
ncbi:MAG: 5-(carboxyamino)imidazole ribonucleotide mutase [Myxococcales bacterium]|nr:5-(carboxyamino)imidazole ribonucleotide mutase [Myxococcales bacterium]